MSGGAIAKRREGETALARSLEEQRALFVEVNNRARERGRPAPYPDVGAAMLSMEIQRSGDGFLVRQRDERLEEVDWDLSGHAASIRASKLVSERTMRGFSQMTDDEARLLREGNLLCSVERAEVADSWGATYL